MDELIKNNINGDKKEQGNNELNRNLLTTSPTDENKIGCQYGEWGKDKYAKIQVICSTIMALCTIFIVIITGIYTYHAGQQVEQMKITVSTATNQNKLTEKAIHLDQRAWIAKTNVTGTPEIGKPFIINICFKNVGKTPAKYVQIRQRQVPVPSNAIPDFTLENSLKPMSYDVITPQQEFCSASDARDIRNVVINDDGMNDIRSGRIRIYAHGIIMYKDIFDQRQWMTYCYYYRSEDSRYVACKEHSDIGTYP